MVRPSRNSSRSTKIDPWFLDQMFLLDEVATRIREAEALTGDVLAEAKRHGFSDRQIAAMRGLSEDTVREVRGAFGIHPVFKTVDTCAAEFAARTPYHYSTYDQENEVRPREREAVIILGAGPNRIGQGIEFDYSCVHAAMSLREHYETIMVNCNPETVSTDYDISDRLYFEPLTLEDVLEIYRAECAAGPVKGMIVQLGGQTPLSLAADLERAGVPILGTSPRAIDLAEDREEFGKVLEAAKCPAPAHDTANTPNRLSPLLSRSATRSSFAPPSCWADAAWQSSTTSRRSANTSQAMTPSCCSRAARSSSTASWTPPSRSMSTPCTTVRNSSWARSWSTSRRLASTRVTPPACCLP